MFTPNVQSGASILYDISQKEIAITGTLPVLRKEMVAWIEANGGRYHDRVRWATDILIVGELPGFITRKLARALELNAKGYGIIILDGAVLYAEIGQYGNAVDDTAV